MKILQVHNFYQKPGGEDRVVRLEADLLRSHGHQVIQFTMHNEIIDSLKKIMLVKKTFWNSRSYKEIKQTILDVLPDVCHFHNTFPLISPSGYYACREHNIPVVQTLHNFRLSCPNGLFYRDGHICEDCLGKNFAWPGVVHACYHKSRTQTFVTAAMLSFHRFLQTWIQKVDVYIALTNFSQEKFIEVGLPEKKIIVSSNFTDIEFETHKKNGGFALFVGRISSEKGLITLLSAFEELPNIPLNIIGDGPMLTNCKEYILRKHIKNVKILGKNNHEDVIKKMRSARLLILPSECYENFPMTILEAYACGLPIIGSRLGAMEELINEGETGLLFEPGNSRDLAKKVLACWENTDLLKMMGKAARLDYEQKYTTDRKYDSLMHIYEKAKNENQS